jgi:acyl-CoA thioester hydrolase
MYRPIETYRGFVYPWAIDHVGHMNVQFYTARFDEATWHFLARIGLSPSFLKRSDRAAVAVDQRTQYKREVLVSSLLHVTTELLELGRKSIRFVHRMYDSETNQEVAVTEFVGVYFDTRRRLSVELPESVREKAEELLAHAAAADDCGNGRMTSALR